MRYSRRLSPSGLATLLLNNASWGQTGRPDLTVRGDISQSLTLKADDLAGMARETVSVADQDGTKVAYEGVPLREVLKRSGIPLGKDLRGKALASYVMAKAHDGYAVVFSLGEIDASFGNESIVIADKRDGKPLFGYQGPFRLVCRTTKPALDRCGCSTPSNSCGFRSEGACHFRDPRRMPSCGRSPTG